MKLVQIFDKKAPNEPKLAFLASLGWKAADSLVEINGERVPLISLEASEDPAIRRRAREAMRVLEERIYYRMTQIKAVRHPCAMWMSCERSLQRWSWIAIHCNCDCHLCPHMPAYYNPSLAPSKSTRNVSCGCMQVRVICNAGRTASRLHALLKEFFNGNTSAVLEVLGDRGALTDYDGAVFRAILVDNKEE
jgi:hypothetical protein